MPALGKFQKITTTDYAVNQLQSNISKVVDNLSVQPLITGNLLQKVALVVGNNTIYHGLDAPLKGWIVTRIRGVAATFYDNQDTNISQSKTLILYSSAAVTVDLVVF